MKGLPKASKAKVSFLTLPKEVETMFDTGYGENNNSKWEMEIDLLDHPTQEPGQMVWQTTASVIRVEIMSLTQDNTKKNVDALLNDLQSSEWYIACDANGQMSIEEV